jgi:hypothetical protein
MRSSRVPSVAARRCQRPLPPIFQVTDAPAGAAPGRLTSRHALYHPQVMSACAVSFSHGANDVANSIGSFSAAFTVYETMKVG